MSAAIDELKPAMKKALIVVVLIVVAYLAGYWPQHARLQSVLEGREQLQTVAALCNLENQLLSVIEESDNKNYGNAQTGSGTFFNGVQAEIDRMPNAPYRKGLDNILARRDLITAALSRADASALGPLRQSLTELRQIMQTTTTAHS